MDSFVTTLSEQLYALFVDCQRVGIRRYEDEGGAQIAAQLSPLVRELLERGCALLLAIVEYGDPLDAGGAGSSEPGTSLGDFDPELELGAQASATPRSPGAVVADIAFMANGELRQHHARLSSHHPQGEVQEMVSDCGSALRAVLKSVYAVEPLLRELGHLASVLPSQLETSLEVRRHYRKLWSFALITGDVPEDRVRAALRGAGTRISILAGSEVYSLLREDDRFYIRELQRRILAWLRGEESDAAGVRIWQDFALFVEILRQVNLREELVSHDRQVLQQALATLDELGERELASVQRSLRPILGVDDELDALVEGQPELAALRVVLRRVVEQFTNSSAPGAAQSVAL